MSPTCVRDAELRFNRPSGKRPFLTGAFGSMTPIEAGPQFKDGGPGRDQRRPGRHPLQTLNLGLLRHFKGVVDLDLQVPHCTFKLGMA
jgi:hypothetical protein